MIRGPFFYRISHECDDLLCRDQVLLTWEFKTVSADGCAEERALVSVFEVVVDERGKNACCIRWASTSATLWRFIRHESAPRHQRGASIELHAPRRHHVLAALDHRGGLPQPSQR